jgi:hypothetical protein
MMIIPMNKFIGIINSIKHFKKTTVLRIVLKSIIKNHIPIKSYFITIKRRGGTPSTSHFKIYMPAGKDPTFGSMISPSLNEVS